MPERAATKPVRREGDFGIDSGRSCGDVTRVAIEVSSILGIGRIVWKVLTGYSSTFNKAQRPAMVSKGMHVIPVERCPAEADLRGRNDASGVTRVGARLEGRAEFTASQPRQFLRG